jgi:hypothetical protein
MNPYKRFYIVTPDGHLSADTFVVAAPQPPRIAAGCLLMVDEQTGTAFTVHATRLIPAEAPELPPVHQITNNVCLKCGHVEGVVRDQVACPVHGEGVCGLHLPVMCSG